MIKSIQFYNYVHDNGRGRYRLKFSDGHTEILRLLIMGNDVREMAYRSRNRCIHFYRDNCVSIKFIKPTSEFTKAKNFIANVAKYLGKSGLWPKMYEAYSRMAELGDGFLEKYLDADYYERQKMLNDYGISSLFVDNLESSAHKGIVSINYHSYEKDLIRKKFADAIKNKEEYDYFWTKGYDNRIGCRNINGHMSAWYSTEYIGCGNGHYYYALDERHAIFCETD